MFGSAASNLGRRSATNSAFGVDESDVNKHRRPFSGELNRLLSAAVISTRFERMLLREPDRALAEGYFGETFELGPAEREIVLSIRASTLQDFALELRNRSQLRQTEDPSESRSSGGTQVTGVRHHRKTSVVD